MRDDTKAGSPFGGGDRNRTTHRNRGHTASPGPKARHTFTDPTSDNYGQTVEFPYCCWTFCAWPTLWEGLRERWRSRGIAVTLRLCAECPVKTALVLSTHVMPHRSIVDVIPGQN